MIVIICLDDDGGMMFNNRRQSQDRILRKRIIDIAAGSRLWMDGYSAKQFTGTDSPKMQIDEDFLAKAGKGEYCFVEDRDISRYEDKVEGVILYKWNRRYPSDFKFTFDMSGWRVSSAEEFAGSSHKMITEERYVKC